MSVSSKKVLGEFIEIYKSHSCLWKVKSSEYHDRDKKEAAYGLLIDKLKEIEPEANRAAVVRKINNLRSNVRKEKKKHENSLKSGASTDDVYRIKLWYYNLFDFLHDQIIPRESSSNLDSDDESTTHEIQTQDSSTNDQENQNSPANESSDSTQSQISVSANLNEGAQQVLASNNISSRPPKPAKTKKLDDTLAHEVLSSVRDHFKRPRPIILEDRYDAFGKNVAIKMRALDKKPSLVAEKLINEILFEAEIGNLTSEHAYINMGDVLRQHRRTPAPYQHQVTPPSPTREYSPGYASLSSPSPYSYSSSSSSNQFIPNFIQAHSLPAQPQHSNQLITIPQANLPSPHSYPTQMHSSPIRQPNEPEVIELSISENSAATFFTNFRTHKE